MYEIDCAICTSVSYRDEKLASYRACVETNLKVKLKPEIPYLPDLPNQPNSYTVCLKIALQVN